MNVAASKSSPDLKTEHGLAGVTQLFWLAWRADPQPLLGALTPVQPGLLSGPLFQLISCTALHLKSCFLSSSVKTQAKQLSLCFGHNLPTVARVCWRRAGEQHHEDVSVPAGNFCTVPSLEGNGTMPILLLTVAQRRWQSFSYLLSKMDMLAGATAWAKPVGMWAATLHACPGSCASSPPPWPHTAPVIAALSPALSSSFVLSAGGRFVLMAGWLMCLSSIAVKSLGRWGMSNLYCATARWAQHQVPTRAWPCSGSIFTWLQKLQLLSSFIVAKLVSTNHSSWKNTSQLPREATGRNHQL